MLDAAGREKLEMAVIGSMLFDPAAYGVISTRLKAEDFGVDVERSLFEAVGELRLAGRPVSTLTIQAHMNMSDETAETVWQTYIPNAVDRDTLAAYCDLLVQDNRLHSLRLLGLRLSGADTLEDADEILGELSASAAGKNGVKPVSALELIADFVNRQGTEMQKPEYLSFGIPALDEAAMVEPGDMVVIGGYSSAGKTLLSLQFALAMAKKYRVGYFSLETGTKKLGNRMIAHLLGTSLKTVKRWENSAEEYKRAVELGAEMSRQPGCLDYIEAAGFTARDIQAYALSYRYQVIFVDYLQIVEDPAKSIYEKVTNISMALHTLAQRHKIAVFPLAQLKRPDKVGAKPVPPGLWSFKESGQIENDADTAMVLYPEDPKDNASNRILAICKQKDGEKVDFTLKFDGPTQTMTYIPPSIASQIAAVKKAKREAEEWEKRQQTFEDLTGVEDKDLPF